MSDIQRKYITLSVWTSIVVFSARLIIAGSTIKFNIQFAYELFGYAGEAIGISTIIMYFYNKCLWKKINIYKVPVLAKRYKGKLIYTWNDTMGDSDITMDIEQTFLSVKVTLETPESISDSINATIICINEEPYLQYLYLNTPNPNLREVSPIHYGYASFKLNDTGCLLGNYFTDRKTVGSVEAHAVS